MFYLKLFIVILSFILNSCSQTSQNNGLSEKKIEKINIEIGKTTKKHLIKQYGPPTFENIFNDNIIYYVSHKTSYKTFNKRETNKLLVIEITLNNSDIVTKYKQYSKKDIQDVNISEDEDEHDIDFTLLWKDLIRALRRTNVED